MKTIIETYLKKESFNHSQRLKIEGRIEQRKAQIVRLQKKLDKLGWVSWIDEIIKPIAEMLIKKMPDRYFEIFGPFGMNSETSIHFYKNGVTNNNRFDGDNCKSITFRPRNLDIGELVLVDYSEDTHQYKEGTLAELNGENYRTVPMKKSIDELFSWMNEQEKVTV